MVSPSLDDLVEFTELVFDWKITRPVAAEGFCNDMFDALMTELLVAWMCATFAVLEGSN